jgi:hypothetical protein
VKDISGGEEDPECLDRGDSREGTGLDRGEGIDLGSVSSGVIRNRCTGNFKCDAYVMTNLCL